jgi:ribonuclease P protein subunit POP4
MPDYNNKNIVIHELVGLDVSVVDSRDQKQIGINGSVIRETKNLLYVKSGDATVKVVKLISEFRFRVGNRRYNVKGEEINFRSHERTEKAFKFYKSRKDE